MNQLVTLQSLAMVGDFPFEHTYIQRLYIQTGDKKR